MNYYLWFQADCLFYLIQNILINKRIDWPSNPHPIKPTTKLSELEQWRRVLYKWSFFLSFLFLFPSQFVTEFSPQSNLCISKSNLEKGWQNKFSLKCRSWKFSTIEIRSEKGQSRLTLWRIRYCIFMRSIPHIFT